MRRCVAILALAAVWVLAGCERTPQTLPDPDPVDLWTVNTATYTFGDMAPVEHAYERVALWMGWDDAKIEAWRTFVITDLIPKESGGCWMATGGTLYSNIGQDCHQPDRGRWGRRTDVGFGQVTPVLYRGKNAPICRHTGMCNLQTIRASAWNSMWAMLTAIDHAGSFPWCWNRWARSYHNCTLAPDR